MEAEDLVLTKSTPAKPGSLQQGKTGVELVGIFVLVRSEELADVVEAVVVVVVVLSGVVVLLLLLTSTLFFSCVR